MTTAVPRSSRVGGLLAAGHAPPSIAVTVMAALLGARAGLPLDTIMLLALAVGSGQFSIGFLNDWWDAEADRAADRSDKPIVAGVVSRSSVAGAAVASTAMCLIASAWLGVAGAVNLAVVAAGWAYDVGAKWTRFSVLPYLVAFGLLPTVATLAATPARWPPAWMVIAGALLGAGGHFANALPDLDSDARVGVRGLPQRLGPGLSLVASAVCLGAGAVIALVAASGALLAGIGLMVVAGMLCAVVVTARSGHRRLAFRITMALAIITVAMLVVPI